MNGIMQSKKDDKKEAVIVEIIAWIFFLGIVYLFARGIFII
jgi:hypothetical protein